MGTEVLQTEGMRAIICNSGLASPVVAGRTSRREKQRRAAKVTVRSYPHILEDFSLGEAGPVSCWESLWSCGISLGVVKINPQPGFVLSNPTFRSSCLFPTNRRHPGSPEGDKSRLLPGTPDIPEAAAQLPASHHGLQITTNVSNITRLAPTSHSSLTPSLGKKKKKHPTSILNFVL